MSMLFGKQRDRAGLLRRVGNIAQVAGIREYTYTSGRADGVKAVEVNTGAFRFELLASRCLDVSFMSRDGIPASYISKSGIRHPAYYAKNDPHGFLDNFLAGALTTCGLHVIGPAAEAEGRHYQIHGDIANMPAEKMAVNETWDGDDCLFTVSGEIRHSHFYHGDLVLRRTVSSRLGASSLVIEDEVENLDFAPAVCLLLYHCQFGFPILDAASRLLTTPLIETRARAGTPDAAVKTCASFSEPADGANEQCFYHVFKPDADGYAAACLFNPELGSRGMGAYVRFRTDTLPLMVQWKMLRSREYVCGLEPATAALDNRSEAELAANTLQPLEKRTYRVEIGIVEGEDEFRKLGENSGAPE